MTDLFVVLSDPEFLRDPHPSLNRVRAQGPLHYSEFSRTWFAVGHDVCTFIFRSRKFSRDLSQWNSPFNPLRAEGGARDRLSAGLLGALQPFMLNAGPQLHGRARALFQPEFLPRAVQALEPLVWDGVRRAGERLPAKGRFDLVETFADVVPGLILGAWLGLPESDLPQIARLSAAIMQSLSPTATPGDRLSGEQALDAFEPYVRGFVQSELRSDGAWPVGRWVQAATASDGLSEVQLVINLLGVLMAAMETGSALIGNMVGVLLCEPGQLQRLREQPELLPSAVEEILRHEPPSTLTPRVALQDVEVGPVRLERGALCFGVNAAANRDPRVFVEPDRVDVARRKNPHVAFGGGIHHCLGAALARLQARVALSYLLERYGRIELDGQALQWRPVVSTRSLESLWVEVG